MGVSRSQNCIAEGGRNSENRTEASLRDRHLPKVNPPSSSPAETVKIAPENLEVANMYLQCQSIPQVASELGFAIDDVATILGKREVRAYIDNIFLDYGFNNKFKMRAIMDAVIDKKLQEMDESDIGSGKDIIEIMALSHKMSMELMDRQIKLAEIESRNVNIKNQTNVQINGGGTKYDSLIEQLMRNDNHG